MKCIICIPEKHQVDFIRACNEREIICNLDKIDHDSYFYEIKYTNPWDLFYLGWNFGQNATHTIIKQ